MRVTPDQLERFHSDLRAVWPAVDDGQARLGLAVSGGPDSLALLLLAHALLPHRIEAATVDHGLRPESGAEAAIVMRLCGELDVPHRTLEVEVAQGNLQEQARLARYEALGEWLDMRGLSALATAHQMDDQAETLVMRLNRGSGVTGLAGIRRATVIPTHGGPLVRPLLGWRRTELAHIVERAGIDALADPSNDNPRFDRVRIRKALADADWLDIVGLARSAALLAEADDMLQSMVAREYADRVHSTDRGQRYHVTRSGQGGHMPVRIGVIQNIFRQLGAQIDRGAAAQLAEGLIAGKPGNVAGIHASVSGIEGEQVWDFAPENPRKTG